MSINIQKVIQIYGHILSMLEAKKNLYTDSSELNGFLENKSRRKLEDKNWCVDFMQGGILKLLRIWKKKFDIYQLLADAHINSYTQLEFRVDNLKNNNQMLSKEDQVLTQIQTKIKEWKQNMYPADYFNIKQRRILKQTIQQKLVVLKNHSTISTKTNAPLYNRKLENEFKENVFTTYYDESQLDIRLVNFTLKVKNELAEYLGKLDNDIDRSEVPYSISQQNNQFNQVAYQILRRNLKPSANKLRNYTELLGQSIKKNQSFWNQLRKSLQQLLFTIDQIFLIVSKMKTNFEDKQQKIYKLLADIPKTVGNIFRIDIIYNFIKQINTSYQINKILMYIKQKLIKRKDYSLRMEIECINFIHKLIKQENQRNNNIHEFAVSDRRFFQQQAKSEKMIMRSLLQMYKQFLQEIYNLAKESRKKVQKQCVVQILQAHQLNPYLIKLIINNNQNAQNITHNGISNNLEENTKLRESVQKIQQFLKSIYIFDSHTQIDQSMTKFTCALGPKLLLHGKLYIHEQGLYFQSQFNKKNILFGKTKLFIPKNQIVDIDMKNTLLVFPDAVVIKTGHGLVSFHALGQQKLIRQAIKETYGHKAQMMESMGQTKIVQFKKFNQSKRRNPQQSEKLVQPLQTKIAQTMFQGSQLNNMFRRYFSDDKFELGGKVYANFKTYFLLQIQALNPQSNSITPPPPTYFSFQTEDGPLDHYPTISERMHKYVKILPKIPFVSKGGQGQCEQIQTYNWFGPDLLVLDIVSIVKGFSLTEGMKIYIRTVLRQMGSAVKMTVSSQIKFQKDSSTNGLVKSPALSNLKQGYAKMVDIMQKCEKTYQRLNNTKVSQISNSTTDAQTIQPSTIVKQQKQIQLSKKNLQLIIFVFVIFYIISLLVIKLI